MANVWKIGSRWSEYGSRNSSILSIFRRNNIVFVGEENASKRFIHEVKKGDYFAIADGYEVVAVAKALDVPKYLNNYRLDIKKYESEIFDYEECKDWTVGVRVKIIDLDDSIWYENRGSFSAANQIWDDVIELYENQNNKFSINSSTCTLFRRERHDSTKSLLDVHTRYIIPVYQRPYSWQEEQVKTFVSDLISGFWGNNSGFNYSEPMFIGTMQLSSKKIIDKNEYWQEVIDGQQRLTTLTILLKELRLLSPNCNKIKRLEFEWLETQINKTQNNYLIDYLSIKNTEEVKSKNNPYFKNALYIRDLLKGLYDNERNDCSNNKCDVVDRFIDYICNDVFFVVIETCAGLSKTLKIFDTINTAGLDLNGSDLFKLRMYEYLKDVKDEDNNAFEKINAIYHKVDRINQNYSKSHEGQQIVNINDVLDYYKDVLIAKYDLPNVLFTYDWTTFYERLFDVLLGVKNWDNFTKVSSPDFNIDINEIESLIDICYQWNTMPWDAEQLMNCDPKEMMFAYNLISCSRYSRYQKIVYLILFRYNQDSGKYRILSELLVALNKVLFIYSIGYARSIYEIHSFMQTIQKHIMNYSYSYEQVLIDIHAQMDKSKEWAEEELKKNIIEKTVWKRLICITSEFLKLRKRRSVNTVEDLLFYTEYDIEHIHANADEKEWSDYDLQNSIGNLCMLESDINRSIGNKSFSDKKQSSKDDGMDYMHSKYATIRELAKHQNKWSERDALHRLEKESNRIFNFLFE